LISSGVGESNLWALWSASTRYLRHVSRLGCAVDCAHQLDDGDRRHCCIAADSQQLEQYFSKWAAVL